MDFSAFHSIHSNTIFSSENSKSKITLWSFRISFILTELMFAPEMNTNIQINWTWEQFYISGLNIKSYSLNTKEEVVEIVVHVIWYKGITARAIMVSHRKEKTLVSYVKILLYLVLCCTCIPYIFVYREFYIWEFLIFTTDSIRWSRRSENTHIIFNLLTVLNQQRINYGFPVMFSLEELKGQD